MMESLHPDLENYFRRELEIMWEHYHKVRKILIIALLFFALIALLAILVFGSPGTMASLGLGLPLVLGAGGYDARISCAISELERLKHQLKRINGNTNLAYWCDACTLAIKFNELDEAHRCAQIISDKMFCLEVQPEASISDVLHWLKEAHQIRATRGWV